MRFANRSGLKKHYAMPLSPILKGGDEMSGKPKHGMTHTRIYQCWADMKQRCLNKNNPWYRIYGARGITVCNEWREFEPFYAWALSSGYSDSLTLDRINNDKGYSPDNCRWATRKQQIHNRRETINKITGYPGVYKVNVGKRIKRFQAQAIVNGKHYHVGYYLTAEEANKARVDFMRRNKT